MQTGFADIRNSSQRDQSRGLGCRPAQRRRAPPRVADWRWLQGDSSSGASPRCVGHCLHCYLPREGEPWPVDPSPPCTFAGPTRPPACQDGDLSGRGYPPSSRGGLRSYEMGRWTNSRIHGSSTTVGIERPAKHLHHEPLREDQEAAGAGLQSSSWPAADPARGCRGLVATGPTPARCQPEALWVNMVTCANRDRKAGGPSCRDVMRCGPTQQGGRDREGTRWGQPKPGAPGPAAGHPPPGTLSPPGGSSGPVLWEATAQAPVGPWTALPGAQRLLGLPAGAGGAVLFHRLLSPTPRGQRGPSFKKAGPGSSPASHENQRPSG